MQSKIIFTVTFSTLIRTILWYRMYCPSLPEIAL